MRSINIERTDQNFYEFNKIIPLTRSQFRVEPINYDESRQLKPVTDDSQFSLLKNLGQEAIELTFSSISDVSIECVKVYDNIAKCMVKALLLSVANINSKHKYYLIDLKNLISGISKTSEEGLPENKSEFENLYHNLSLREQKVLHEVSKGKTSNEIAGKLFISTNTVKNHRKNIKKKLKFDDNHDYSRFLKWSLGYCDKEI